MRKLSAAVLILLGSVVTAIWILFLTGFSWRDIGKPNYRNIITEKTFLDLNSVIIKRDSLKNIAVLPENEYIVINGTVINTKKKTFGQEPDLSFYMNYYQEGDKNKYNSFNNLLDSIHVQCDSTQTMNIIEKMKSLGIADIIRDKTDTLLIEYRWDVSAMWGEEGIVYTSEELSPDKFYFQELDKNFYHFTNE